MSDQPVSVDTHDSALSTLRSGQKAAHAHAHEDPIADFSSNLLDRGDSFIYATVGICFFTAALFALGYSFWDFTVNMLHVIRPEDVAGAIIKLVSDLLLVLIIMEVLGTVIHYLKSHATSLRPFLFIGIVSATRGVLSIGARLSIEGQVSPADFPHAMIELGVNAAVILALGLTLKLLGKLVDD
ncbi:MAG TPA: phosphate-starvation-inducible PsiE family protein [Ktedonobacteraceae bacterium]|nr:phosphate-starvation-inducible PsiE family protein [Ktedonobacteraceae bacterium]